MNVMRQLSAVAVLVSCLTGGLGAQNRPVGPPNGPDNRAKGQGGRQGGDLSPSNIQQMFDTLTVMEAEKFLPLGAEQFPAFVQRLRRLQDARMQNNRRRAKALGELRSLVGPQANPDATDQAIEAKLAEVARVEADGQAAVRKALDELEQGLSPRQRARFRLLEENIERRKIDFLTKVRQGGGTEQGFAR
jgi:hypothetical protein